MKKRAELSSSNTGTPAWGPGLACKVFSGEAKASNSASPDSRGTSSSSHCNTNSTGTVIRMGFTSPAGTDLRVNIEGRPALQVTPIKQRGQMMGPIPLWSEVAFAAVEDKTEGRVVVDGIMLGIGLPGQTPNPIEWRVEKGKAVAIEGGEEAEKLKQVIKGVDGATVIGEFAFGHRSCQHATPKTDRRWRRADHGRAVPWGADPSVRTHGETHHHSPSRRLDYRRLLPC